VISVTRLNGTEIVVNADLIETVEATPDTVITLVDGKKYVVHERTDEVVERIRLFRASILRRVDDPHIAAAAELYVLPHNEGQ
jgi:flagellar protein FlbD